MISLEKILAIRAQLNVSAGTPPITLSTGEKIVAWSLIDERGNPVTEDDLDDNMLEEAYQRHVDWDCPEGNK